MTTKSIKIVKPYKLLKKTEFAKLMYDTRRKLRLTVTDMVKLYKIKPEEVLLYEKIGLSARHPRRSSIQKVLDKLTSNKQEEDKLSCWNRKCLLAKTTETSPNLIRLNDNFWGIER